jgi:hypothetical protein
LSDAKHRVIKMLKHLNCCKQDLPYQT